MCTLPHSQTNRWFQCHYNINFNTLILPSPNEDETFVLTLRTITPSMDSSPCLKDILFHHQFSTSLLHMLLQWDQSCVHSDGVQILPVLPFREYYITWKQKPWLEPRYFTRAALYSNMWSPKQRLLLNLDNTFKFQNWSTEWIMKRICTLKLIDSAIYRNL